MNQRIPKDAVLLAHVEVHFYARYVDEPVAEVILTAISDIETRLTRIYTPLPSRPIHNAMPTFYYRTTKNLRKQSAGIQVFIKDGYQQK